MERNHRFGSALIGLGLFATGCDKGALDENVYGRPVVMLDASLRLDASLNIPDSGNWVPLDDAGRTPEDEELAARVTAECGPRPEPVAPYSKRALFRSVSACVQRESCELAVYARELAEKTAAYASAPSAESRALAQSAWLRVNGQAQRLELFQIGPAQAGMSRGAQNLRAQFVSFPSTDRCLVDEQLVAQSYAAPTFASSPSTGRGLSALEYLLFFEPPENGCSPISTINRNMAWQALAAQPDELNARRREYAKVAAERVQSSIQALADAWDPRKGNFGEQLSEPGSGSVYMSEQSAMNALADALYFLEEMKDSKLLRVLPGMSEECPNGCPDRLESPYARVSGANIRQNLAGFRALFQGCGEGHVGLGVDDALTDLGPVGVDLAQRIVEAVAVAERALDEVGGPLESVVLSDPGRVQALYFAVREIRELMKGQLYTLLDVEPPMSAEGDND